MDLLRRRDRGLTEPAGPHDLVTAGTHPGPAGAGRATPTDLAGRCAATGPANPAKLTYATRIGEFTSAEFPALPARLHRQLAAPIVLIRDNLSGHLTGTTGRFVAAGTSWLTVVQLPGYAPELNATEGAWTHQTNGVLANLTARTLPELTQAVHRGLRHIQRHPALLTGFLAGTGPSSVIVEPSSLPLWKITARIGPEHLLAGHLINRRHVEEQRGRDERTAVLSTGTTRRPRAGADRRPSTT